MQFTPLVSVIIPCYNAAPFLKETLDSVFKQTFQDYEIILIDDGSTDNTAQIVLSFGDKVVAEFTPNRGASAARNSGTQLAKGKFIQYLDADDLLKPDALEKRVKALLSTDADVAYCDWQQLVELEDGTFQPKTIRDRKIEDVHSDPEIALFKDFWCPPAALLYSKKILSKIGLWNESLPIIQDARFLLDAALVGGKFVHVPGVSAYYRVHGNNSLSRRSQIKFVLDCFYNACQVEEIWKKQGGITQERSIVLQQVYGQTARFFFEHDRQKFSEVREKIFVLNPSYIPPDPKALNILSRWFGYDQAEAIALKYRQLKKKIFYAQS
jgi:glycosyltransferase involved in cell wall biosynthesis